MPRVSCTLLIKKYFKPKYYKIYSYDRYIIASLNTGILIVLLAVLLNSLALVILASIFLFIFLFYLAFQFQTYSPKVSYFYLNLKDNQIIKKTKQKTAGRLVFISDLHIHEYLPKHFLERVISKINALKPDALLIGGDYVVDSLTDLKLLNVLSKLNNYPKYGVLGNHDYDITGEEYGENRFSTRNMEFAKQVEEILENNSINILRNEFIIIKLHEHSIGLFGTDELWSGNLSLDRYSDLLSNNIILTHNPKIFDELNKKNISLVLSGHNHGGGQMKLTKYISIHRLYMLLPDRFSRWMKKGFNRMTCGLYTNKHGLKLYLSRGIGMTTVSVRINCAPEITVIDLVA